MNKFLGTLLVVALLCGMAWLNWDKVEPVVGPLIGAPPAPTPAATGAATLGATPEPLVRRVLIDPTTSTDTSFREAMKAQVRAAVDGYVPAKPDPRGGVPAVAGLDLIVRLVGTDSLAYGQQNAAVSIPSVPELPARPDMTAEGALDPGGPYDTWTSSEETWSAAYDAALAAQASALDTLEQIDLNRDESSGITAGVAALALLAPADGDVAFAVLSDLDENRDPQPAALHGHPLLVVQPDVHGDIATWDGLFTTFSAWAQSSGAGEITRVRPEAAASAITRFIRGK